MAEIQLRNICKKFDDGVDGVKDFNLDIHDGEFVVFVGPSGCGKSTTLRMIAGLEKISSGTFFLDGQIMNEVESCDRDIAMVFQNYALYPHMTVAENMAYSLRLKKVPKKERRKRVEKVAETLGLQEVLDRKPGELSGGQKQRVAMGRAIVRNPKVFLMDEPLSNLDAKLRNHMRGEILKLYRKLKGTFIYVTHDQTEAMTLGTKIVVIKDGKIQQVATPKELYNNPINLFVAGFIGSPSMNFFRGRCRRGENYKYYLEVGDMKLELTEEVSNLLWEKGYLEEELVIGVRPEDIKICDEGMESTVCVYEMLGAEVYLHFDIEGRDIVVREKADTKICKGDRVHLCFDMDRIHLFDRNTEVRIWQLNQNLHIIN